MVRCFFLLAIALALVAPASGQDLTPNSGPLTFSGFLLDGDEAIGQFKAEAILAEGNFSGSITASLPGVTFNAPLMRSRSYLENDTCLLYAEEGRNRLLLRGPCDSLQYGGQEGSHEGFFQDIGMVRGGMIGLVTSAGGTASEALAAEIIVPTSKLTCFWYEHHLARSNYEINEYLTAISMMVVLTLHQDGWYETAASEGYYRLAGNKVILDGGMFDGAIGTLEPDRSGEAAIVFYRDENKDAWGAPLVDPDTTHCTQQD